MARLITASIVLWAAAAAFAPGTGWANDVDRFEQQQHKVASTHKWRRWTNGRGEEVPSAPELDPRAGAQALTLLLGGFAMISSRKRTNTPSV